MSGFKLNDLNKINDYERLTNALNMYNGVLPKFLRVFVDNGVYEENLRKNNTYDKVQDEYYQIRINRKKSKNHNEFDINELDTWLDNNKEIEKLLIDLTKIKK